MSITTGLPGSIIQAFSWMLIHSIWQGLILALFAGLILILTKRASAAIRYNLVLALFAVFLLTVAGTFVYEYNNTHNEAAPYQFTNNFSFTRIPRSNNHVIVRELPATNVSPFYSINNIKDYLNTIGSYFSDHSFLIVMLWFLFFMVKSASMAGNMLYMHRARRYRVNEPDGYWKERVELLCEQLQVKKVVSLLESAYIKVPVVIGYFKPVILIPVGLIAGIPAAQVEAVLLHELAHIRRNDYMVNFLQNAIEAVFFFNPGLLWISARLREERENCCDDMAISQTNNKEEFVQALISFKEYSVIMPAYATAFSGQKSSLLNRIMRIAYQENKTLSVKESGIFIIGVAMLLLMAFTVYPAKNLKAIKSAISAVKLPVRVLDKVNVVGTHDKNTAIPQITASDARITGIANADDNSKTITGISPDSINVSAIHSYENINNKGPNFLVFIDGKEYPRDILYKISASCLNGWGIFRPEWGLQKYGQRASDGYIEIRTKHGEITYMSAVERENLMAQYSTRYSTSRSKFYNRIALKKEDGSFDKDEIVLNVKGGGMVKGSLPHNGKAGFYIDKDFYTEETITKVSSKVLTSLTGEYGVEGSDPNVPREKGYALIFKFNTKKTSAVLPTPDTIKYARVIGEGLGPNPLVLINGKEYPADILSKINPVCFNGSGTYGLKQAVEKFGQRAKDGCVEIRTKGAIVYLTQAEQENRIAEASVDKNKFYERIVLKDNAGKLYDKIIITEPTGRNVLTDEISHAGKAAFYIDKTFYTEEQYKKLPLELIASIAGGGVRPPNPKIDKAGYEVVFNFMTQKYYQSVMKDTVGFNTTDFKVKDNAVIGELIKSLPGFKIKADGIVYYKDVEVSKLLLNDKPYTGGGSQQGIESIPVPANTVAQVQVVNTFDDNGRTKTINLVTKPNDTPVTKQPQRVFGSTNQYNTWKVAPLTLTSKYYFPVN